MLPWTFVFCLTAINLTVFSQTVVSQSTKPETNKVACEQITCDLFCEYGLRTDVHGCRICECQVEICQDVQCPLGKLCKAFQLTSSGHKVSRCLDPRLPEKCHPPMDSGPCRASYSRSYYNSDSDSCQPFIYGGCQGNENNFATAEECETFCLPQDLQVECSSMSSCTKYCEHGYKLDESNCEICECADSVEINPFGENCSEPLTTCLMDCEYGFKKDLRGCDICECEEKPKCNEVMCAMYCKDGFQKDNNGCDICKCRDKPQCPAVMCAKHCEYGFQKDENGCDICQCSDKPQCPAVMCAKHCEYGFKKDENGCDICQCRDKPQCAEVMCARYCEYGFQKDENGCDICQCSDKPQCPAVMCARYCEYGFKKDENGCDICQCRDKPQCAAVMCARYCEYGFKKDENGCDICKCKEPGPNCPPYQCRMYCEYGFVIDEFGCSVCKCRERPSCPAVMCAMYCENGFEKDENGCDICKCSGEYGQCSPMHCQMYCEYGLMKDEFGCEVCQCSADPCTAASCSPTHVCVARRQDDCKDCKFEAYCIAGDTVRRIKIELHFVHDEMNEIDIGLLNSLMRHHLSTLLGTDEDSIRRLVVVIQDPETIAVSFYVVSYGNYDLVSAYQKFEMDVKAHLPGTSFPYSEVTFIPEHMTLSVHYYEDATILEGESYTQESGVSSAKVGLLVGCTIAAIVVAVLVTVWVVLSVRSKNVKHDRSKVSYIRAPDARTESEKPPII